ncbi:MAG: methyltransferase domain-containing protein [Halioglobus sp.]
MNQPSGLSQTHNNLDCWHCPACSGGLLADGEDAVVCSSCTSAYPAVEGIPDLRKPGVAESFVSGDLEEAKNVSRAWQESSIDGVAADISSRLARASELSDMRSQQIQEAPAKFTDQFEGWLKPYLGAEGGLLDIGCGTGGLLAAAATRGIQSAGIDASMVNLLAAKRMILAAGGTPRLACAFAESLPIPEHKFGLVTMYDSIEHVTGVAETILQARRVLAVDGHMAISTPNRYSLSAEPHVRLWGVGFLPRRYQAAYVKWRTGDDYSQTCLLSSAEMSRLLEASERLTYWFILPSIPEQEIRLFSARRAMLARLYNRLVASTLLRPVFLTIGPFYQVVARRDSP